MSPTAIDDAIRSLMRDLKTKHHVRFYPGSLGQPYSQRSLTMKKRKGGKGKKC